LTGIRSAVRLWQERVAVVATEIGISKTAIYAALKRREGKQICPCCGQVIRMEGKKNERYP